MLASAIVRMLRCRRRGRSREPGSKALLFPTLASEQNGAGALDEEHTQIAVSAPSLMRPRIVRSPVDICFATVPSHAAKSRPFCKAAPLPIAATMALAMIGPMPGTLINCPQFTSVRARASISSVTCSIRSSRYFQSSTVSPIILVHPGRQRVGARGYNLWQLLPQRARSLPHGNAVLQKKTTDLIDYSCPITNQARTHAVQRLQI